MSSASGPSTGARELARLLAPLRERPEDTAVLSDIDGTLARITREPEEAYVPERTRATLRELARGYRLVACVTGRPALQARRMVGVEEVVYAGNHGLELLAPGAPETRFHPAIRGRERAAADFVQNLSALELTRFGLRLEDKGPIQAIHWRGADSEARAEAHARALAEEVRAADLVPRFGRKVLEIRPLEDVDKGWAVRRLIERSGVRAAFFGGDDLSDIEAFETLGELRASGDLDLIVRIGVVSPEAPAELDGFTEATVAGIEGFRLALRLLVGDR